MVSNNNIEKRAVSAIENYISRCCFLEPMITSSDKNPIWDGTILLYKNKNHSNSTLLGPVNVQVKGITVKTIKEKFTYSIRLDDLQKYKEHGGIVYFIVAICKNHDELYYKTLLPTEIHKLTFDKEQQKTISIAFSEMPKNHEDFEKVINSFYINSQKQYSSGGISINMRNALQKGIHNFVAYNIDYNKQDALLSISKSPLNVYGVSNNIHIPIAEKLYMMFVQDCNVNVKVNNITFFKTIRLERIKGNYVIGVGKGLKLIVKPQENHFGVTYDCKSKMLNDIISEYEFLIALYEYETIKFNEFEIEIKNLIAPADAQKFKENLEICKQLQQLWKSLHMCVDLDMAKLSKIDNDNIHILYSALIENKTIPLDIKHEKFIFKVEIAGYELAIVGYPITDTNEFCIKDFFQSEEYVTYDENGVTRKTSLFSFLEKDDYLKCLNVPYNEIASSYEKYANDNPDIFLRATTDLLEMLKAYDCMSSTDVRKNSLLNACEELSKWLLQSDPEQKNINNHKLNAFQIIRRQRKYSMEERKELVDIEMNSKSNMEKVAANLLLGDEEHYNFFFSKLTLEEQNNFKSFPIYNLKGL